MDNGADRIMPLEELEDFQVTEGDPDVRGWDVLSADGMKVGEVDDLIVDTSAMLVRYLDVDIEGDTVQGDRHVLIPIGHARLDEDSDRVFVDSLSASGIQRLPEYRHGILTSDFEDSLRVHFGEDVDLDSTMPIPGEAGMGASESTDGTR